METEIKENGNIIYRNENKEYKFINMGEYIGYNTRQWYESAPVCYRLMAYNESQDDGVLHIEALIDSIGDYSRLIVKKGIEERVISLSGKFICEDVVYVMGDSNEFIPRDRYVAFEDDYATKVKYEDYFGKEKTFVSESGKTYEGEVTKDDYITNFMRKNVELSHMVGMQDNTSMSM